MVEQNDLKQQKRTQILLEAARVFIQRGSQVMILKPRSTDPVDGKYISDFVQVEFALADNPLCNIAAIAGKDQNLIAIKLERESDYDPDPQDILMNLEGFLGKLPTTLTVEYSNKAQYRFYEYPENVDIHLVRIDTGIQVVKNNFMGTSGLILLEKSDYLGGTVKELSHSGSISILPAKWVEYICTCPDEDLLEVDLPVKAEPVLPIEDSRPIPLPPPVLIEGQELCNDPQICVVEERDPDNSHGIYGSQCLHDS
jgi:hypothetical protein